ncbi:hypothetical protein SUGI_0414210 [Cryptomeria japonica]|nr:hypothetical protein SUGI_0414210 [Cryptomeria japonica]
MTLVPNFVKSREAMKSVFKILDRQTRMEPEDPEAFNVEHLKGDIEFRNATSGLDAESERVVQETLERVMEGRTSVIVAHRLSTIKNVATIAVVKEGRIAEQRSHSELMCPPK